jgi:hypothetical protein
MQLDDTAIVAREGMESIDVLSDDMGDEASSEKLVDNSVSEGRPEVTLQLQGSDIGGELPCGERIDQKEGF